MCHHSRPSGPSIIQWGRKRISLFFAEEGIHLTLVQPAYSGFQLVNEGRLMRTLDFVKNFHKEESGQDLLEYALVLAAVLAAVVAGSTSIASTINTAMGHLNNKITSLIS